MSRGSQSRKRLVLLALIAIMGMMVSCYFSDDSESVKNYEFRYYTFDPATILKTLDRGNTNVFTLITTTPEAMSTPSAFPDSVSWSQAEYFRVAQALYQQAWQEPFKAQNIYAMDFEMNCAEAEQGLFSKAELYSFKVFQTGKEETRVEYHNSIYLSDHDLITTRGEYTPNIEKKEALDLTQFRISAEEALQIAEKNGGAEKRLKYEDDCKINVSALGYKGTSWEVIYKNHDGEGWLTIFKITVDPQTESFEVWHPKP